MIALDTFPLLRSIAQAPETFATVETDLERAAVASVKKLLKAKGLTLDDLCAVNRALGADALGFILGHDSMTEKDIKGLVRKLDKHWPALSGARVDAQRDHLIELATGTVQPAQKVAPPRPPARNGSPRSKGNKKDTKAKTAEFSTAMSARPQKVA